MVKKPAPKGRAKSVTPEKPPTKAEATIFSKALKGLPLTESQIKTMGGRGMSELAAAAKAHTAAVEKADAAKKALQNAAKKAKGK